MKTTGKRQIVLIMTDTQRIDMLGCYGNVAMKTPNLDRLASQGVRFNRAYTCQPVCGPARSAIFTGTYPHSTGSWGNSMALGDNVKTIGQRLTDNGIHSGYVGKWHLDGGDYFGLGRCPGGWDPEWWYDMRRYLEELTPEARVASRRTGTNVTPGISEEFTYGHRVANRARDFIVAEGNNDFFLTVSFDEPHGPFLAPEPFASMYRDYRPPVPPNADDPLADKPEHQKVWAASSSGDVDLGAFLGCNSFADYEIGRILEAVDEHCRNALVIYTSDHGDALLSHRITGKGPAVYDEVARVPFIVRWPGHVGDGAVNDTPVSHIDIVPTILEYFSVPRPRVLDGESMLAEL